MGMNRKLLADIEGIICSVELAKKLKEIHVPQQSIFYWLSNLTRDTWHSSMRHGFNKKYHSEALSAFTSEELSKFLPFTVKIDGKKNYLTSHVGHTYNMINTWIGYHEHDEETSIDIITIDFDAKKEVDARAKMLIYLIEKGLVKF